MHEEGRVVWGFVGSAGEVRVPKGDRIDVFTSSERREARPWIAVESPRYFKPAYSSSSHPPGETVVRLRVTLSYFIEPNPGSRGWVRRYRYASHSLRFDVRRATESNDDFRKRINQLALAENEARPPSHASDTPEWYFGPDYRVSGSLHTDIWSGTAADLAQRGGVAIYPVTGWWKERPSHDHSDRGARYALIVSIETPGQDVDIWTPVAQEVGIPTEIIV